MTRKPQFCRHFMQQVENVYPLLGQNRNIVITMHQKPDGDAMGAALGLYFFLKSAGDQPVVISPTNWANFLKWMPGCKDVIDFERKPEQFGAMVHAADIIFCLDFNAMYRTKRMEQVLTDAKGIKVLIDHHQQPQEELFTYGASNVLKSSTCEMVYDFIVHSPFGDKLDKDMATCLYTGIMTDTGSFRFSITTAHVHRAVAHMLELGIDHAMIHEKIYDSFMENRLRFIGHALLNRLEVLYEYNTALMVISKRDIVKYEIQTGDTEGLVNYLLSMDGIILGALLIDRIEERKWSFRSKGDFDVNKFARAHFEGGGHKNAAGGRSAASLEANVEHFKEVLKQYKQQLN